MSSVKNARSNPADIEQRAETLFNNHRDQIAKTTDRMFALLMMLQWAGGIVAAVVVSPRTWAGSIPSVHIHVWSALLCGGVLSSLPIFLALRHPGQRTTRYTIAVAQMLWSALLIHLAGGRIETHFHVFGSLAFLAMYRDWRVLIPATIVISVDHAVRGIFWPQSVYGVLTATPWRTVEHASWVIFEDIFLIRSCLRSTAEMRDIASQRVQLEQAQELTEREVEARTEELRISEERLRASESRIRNIFDHAANGIITIEEEGTIDSVNNEAARMFGYGTEELLGQNIETLMPSPYGEGHDQNLWKYLRTGAAKAIATRREMVGRRKDGSTFPLDLGVSEVCLGERRTFTGIVRDITDIKEAVNALRENQEYVENIIGSMIDMLVVVAPDGSLVTVNEATCGALGYTKQELIGQPASLLFSEEEEEEGESTQVGLSREALPCKRGVLQNLVKNGSINNLEKPLRRKNGQMVPALMSGSTMYDSDGSMRGIVCVAQDITERKKAEDALAKANRDLQLVSRQAGMAEIANGVLHNVGNVLNSVNVSAALVTEKLRQSKVSSLTKAAALISEHTDDLETFISKDEKGRQLPGYLTMLAEHLSSEQAETIKELRSLTENVEHIKAIVGKQQSYAGMSGMIERMNMAEVLDDVLKLHADSTHRHTIKVKRQYDAIPPIMADKHKLLQILVNLIRNAKDALVEGVNEKRCITVRMRTSKDDRLRIDVVDNGPGISPADLTKVFAHGFTTKKGGHGFGLHASALAAKEMSGSLTARSDGPGKGATFTLELPLKSDGVNT